jgi:hypothetical protein
MAFPESELTTNSPGAGNKPEEGQHSASEFEPRQYWLRWGIALAGGLLAGIISWLAGEPLHNVFEPKVFPIKIALTTFIQPTNASLNDADVKNATVVFSILGGVTGLVMGIAGGFAARALGRGLIVGLVGLVAGVIIAGAASLGLLPLFYRRIVPDPNDLLSPILIHSGVWAAIGAVGGLAFAIGMKSGWNTVNAIFGACVGAFVATLLFHGLGEFLFDESASSAPLASAPLGRLLADMLVTVLVAFGAARGALSRFAYASKSPRLLEI